MAAALAADTCQAVEECSGALLDFKKYKTSAKKKARGLGAAAEKAVAEVTGGAGGKRLARGAGGPGRSPMNEFAARGMGAVARSPLANVR